MFESSAVSNTLLENIALSYLIFTKGPVFLLDEDSTRVTTFTNSALLSLFTPTVTIAGLVIAGFDADTAITSLGVETFFVFVRADCGVLTLVNISAAQIVLSHRVAGITADMTAQSVEAGLTLWTD